VSREYQLQPFQAPVELQINYAAELNEQQYAAVTAPPGPSLVIAGAGSGKTRTLTYRVAWLIEQGVPPERILLLTFTNKAAKEMMRRVGDLLHNDTSALWGGTFHSVGARILRRHADRLGYQPDFTILDREDARELLDACLGAADIDVKATRFPKADVLADIFSMAVNTGRTVAEILAQDYDYFSHLAPQIVALHDAYQARKRAANGMDFDDLLVLWLRLLRDHADVRELYQRRFRFVLVDEYQDTNRLQSDLIDLLAAAHRNVMVVGDDSQSIYSWRGANFANILEFPKRYPGAAVYKIEVNYRSTPEILALANAAIAANVRQFAKQLTAARKPGARPALVVCEDAGQQAAFVAQRALELREEGVPLNGMCVLYRSHFHALELQLELTRRNIPFSITSGIRFFEQAHVKDVSAYLKLVHNPRDELSFKRLAKMLPGVGAKSADKLWQSFHDEVQRVWPQFLAAQPPPVALDDDPDWSVEEEPAAAKSSDASFPLTPALSPGERGNRPQSTTSSSALATEDANLLSTKEEHPPAARLDTIPPLPKGEGRGEGEARPSIAKLIQKCAKSVPKKAAVAWAQFAATIHDLEADDVRGNAGRMIELAVQAGYEDYLKETYTNYRTRLEDLEQLASFATSFSSLDDFLTQMALLTNVEAEEDKPDDDTERLKLSTIHQAKGLEFDVVFVIMLCDGLFPSARSLDEGDTESEEEERRLFYVAITRAKNELYLSYPLIRAMAGYSGDSMQVPSRFLGELPRELVEEWNLKPAHPYR
jgi:superfamily I DNA/RNA helicase